MNFIKLFSDPNECEAYISESKTEKVSGMYDKQRHRRYMF